MEAVAYLAHEVWFGCLLGGEAILVHIGSEAGLFVEFSCCFILQILSRALVGAMFTFFFLMLLRNMQNGCLMLTWTFEWYFSHLKDVCETCIRSIWIWICTLSYRARSDWLSHRYSWQVHSLPRDRRPWSKRISMLLSLLPRMCGIYTIKSFAMFLYWSVIASIKLALSCISLGNSSVVGDMRIIILWLLLLTHEATDARKTDDASFNWFGFFVDEGI